MKQRSTRSKAASLARAIAATVGGIAVVAAAPVTAEAELVIDLRATSVNGVPASDPNVVAINGVGDVVAIDVYARVSGADDVNDEAFRSMHGVFRSSTGGLLGDLQSFNVAPFDVVAAQGGSQVDVDDDGDLDIGQMPNGGQANTFFVAFASVQELGGTVVNTSPSTEEFLIGTMTWTAISAEGETFLDFIRRRNPGNPGSNSLAFASWAEDLTSGTASTRGGTSPYTTDGLRIVGVPEPSGVALASLTALGLLKRRSRTASAV